MGPKRGHGDGSQSSPHSLEAFGGLFLPIKPLSMLPKVDSRRVLEAQSRKKDEVSNVIQLFIPVRTLKGKSLTRCGVVFPPQVRSQILEERRMLEETVSESFHRME